MSNRVTMADVAREAGVSLMTVSRVVNHKADVSSSTRHRVLQIIQQLNYRPSDIARGLATQRTGTLGLVVPDIANPFFSAVARGVEREAHAHNYSVFLCNTDEDPQRECALLATLDEKRVDGIIVCSSRLPDHDLHAMLSRHPAAVLVNRSLASAGLRFPGVDRSKISAVMADDEHGGYLATRHLLQRGHRAIAFLAGPENSYSGWRRAQGYHMALAEARVAADPGWERHCAPIVEAGTRAARRLLHEHSELTALFCYNDLVAVGALRACVDLGYGVPSQVAIVGFDDISLAALVTPSLTTCRVPREDLGTHAMRLLLDQLEEGAVEPCEVLLQPELVIRSSA